jgi:hypothetical protein
MQWRNSKGVALDYSLKIHNPLKPCMTVVKLGRIQEYRWGEDLNLEPDPIIDLPAKGKTAVEP